MDTKRALDSTLFEAYNMANMNEDFFFSIQCKTHQMWHVSFFLIKFVSGTRQQRRQESRVCKGTTAKGTMTTMQRVARLTIVFWFAICAPKILSSNKNKHRLNWLGGEREGDGGRKRAYVNSITDL